MNRIQQLFEDKSNNVLSIYFTAGYPELNQTATIIKSLADAGVDMIEIGIPFSDPVADGPTIQQSNDLALSNGMSVKLLFEQLKEVRQDTGIPLVLMGYLNPVMQFGFEAFCQAARDCGIDGLIIPDLPQRVYLESYKSVVEQYSLEMIQLICPHTSQERIREIDALSEGFIYLVTSSAVTGSSSGFEQQHLQYLNKVKTMQLKNPVMAGFGIRNHEDFSTICQYAQGGIIGSSFIRAINEKGRPLSKTIPEFIKMIKGH